MDGSRVRLAEVEVGDETGIVSLRARDEQIDLLQQVSQRQGAAVLRNCTLELYQGKHIRLAVTKWGKLTPYPDQIASTPPPPSKINYDRNFSLIDLSLVASETPVALQTVNESDPGARSQSYQQPNQQGNAQRRTSGRRTSTRATAKGSTSTNQGSSHVRVLYPETGTMPYPHGLQGFSGSMQQEGMNAGGYGYRQPAEGVSNPSSQQQQQQMMLQHQYEIQQRQMQQMYHSSRKEYRGDHPALTMHIPGMGPMGSFDAPTSFGGNPPTTENMAHLPGQRQQDSRKGSPVIPGKMNPQAATYDPYAHQWAPGPH